MWDTGTRTSINHPVFCRPEGDKSVNSSRADECDWAYDLGRTYLGPIVLHLVEWIFDQAEGYDGVLFSARDGYFIKKVYDYLADKKYKRARGDQVAPSHYFYTSRKSAVALIAADEEDTINLLVGEAAKHMMPDEMLREVFCMDAKDVVPYDVEAYGDERYRYFWDYYDEVVRNERRLRRNFYRYMGREGLVIGGRYLFYDFYSSGTVQRSLSNLVPFEMDGIYYRFHGNHDFDGAVSSYFPDESRILTDNYRAMEDLLSSPEGSLWGFDDEGRRILCHDARSKYELDVLAAAQDGALHYICDATSEMGNGGPSGGPATRSEIEGLIAKLGDAYERESLNGDTTTPVDDWMMGIKSENWSQGHENE